MIKVKLQMPYGKFESLRVKGHAEFGPNGHDLVCAGVSAIMTGGINALKNSNIFEIFQDNGIAVIKLKKKCEITNYDAVVINTILTQLETIETSYPDHISLNYIERKPKK